MVVANGLDWDFWILPAATMQTLNHTLVAAEVAFSKGRPWDLRRLRFALLAKKARLPCPESCSNAWALDDPSTAHDAGSHWVQKTNLFLRVTQVLLQQRDVQLPTHCVPHPAVLNLHVHSFFLEAGKALNGRR